MLTIYKRGNRSVVGNYRAVSLTSVVCKQMDHVVAGYLRKVWEMNGWLYEGHHGFRSGYSCECEVVTFCQDITDSLYEGVRADAIIIFFSKVFDLFSPDRLFTKLRQPEWL
jgi:hypothetical protein